MDGLSFDIKDSKDLFQKLSEEYRLCKNDRLSTNKAINFACTAWDLAEWVAKEQDPELSSGKIKEFKSDIKSKCPSLSIMQDICNGVKHRNISKYNPVVLKTEKHNGDFNDDFSRDFDISALFVIMGDGNKIFFEDEVEKVMDFWNNYFL